MGACSSAIVHPKYIARAIKEEEAFVEKKITAAGVSVLSTITGVKDFEDPFEDKLDAVTNAWTQIAYIGANNKVSVRKSSTITSFPKQSTLECDVVVLKKEPRLHLRLSAVDEDQSDIVNSFAAVNKAVEEAAMKLREACHGVLYYYDTNDQAESIGHKKYANCLPTSEVKWDTKTIETSVGLQQFVFYGLGQAVLSAVRSPHAAKVDQRGPLVYEADVTFMTDYEVRAPFENYGTVAFFNAAREPVAIYMSFHQRVVYADDMDPAWIHAMAVFRSAIITVVTLREHLAWTHMVIANGLNLAARETLSPIHPLRRLLKPHHYHTTSVNFAAQKALLVQGGIAFHLFGIHKKDYVRAMAECIDGFQYRTFPEFVDSKGLSVADKDEFPFFKDGREFWAIVKNYVSNYLLLFYPTRDVASDREIVAYWAHHATNQLGHKPYGLGVLTFDALVDQVTNSIFAVTAGHQFYGGVVEYLLSPNVAPSKIAPDSNRNDIQTYNLALSLIALTGNKMPLLMNSWDHLHSYLIQHDAHTELYPSSPEIIAISTDKTARHALHGRVLEVLQEFNAEMLKLSNEVDHRNVHRDAAPGKKKFVCCKPSIMDCSVSI